jgi:hypothetical protein
MRRNGFRRFAIKIYSAFGKVEPAAMLIAWITGMFLAVVTVVAILSILSPLIASNEPYLCAHIKPIDRAVASLFG